MLNMTCTSSPGPVGYFRGPTGQLIKKPAPAISIYDIFDKYPITAFTQLRNARWEYQTGRMTQDQAGSLLNLWITNESDRYAIWEWIKFENRGF